jgi:hypothetical protein
LKLNQQHIFNLGFNGHFQKFHLVLKAAKSWDSLTNKRATEKKRHADVYVFCLLSHDNKTTINPLNMNHWEFYVLSTIELNKYQRSQNSITLNSLKKLTKSVLYNELYKEIKNKQLGNQNALHTT